MQEAGYRHRMSEQTEDRKPPGEDEEPAEGLGDSTADTNADTTLGIDSWVSPGNEAGEPQPTILTGPHTEATPGDDEGKFVTVGPDLTPPEEQPVSEDAPSPE